MATTQNIGLNLPPYNSTNWNTPLNSNSSILDAVLGSTLNVNFYGYDAVLSPSQLQYMRFNLTGNIGGGSYYLVIPNNIGGRWIVSNNTTASGGNIYVRTANYSNKPILVPTGGSDLLFSDGKNIYSAVSGSENFYLPLTGGEITGGLQVDKDIVCNGSASVAGNFSVPNGLTILDNVKINGLIDFSGSGGLSVQTLGVGTAPVGTAVMAVYGNSQHNGDMNITSGNINLSLGNLSVQNNQAVNTINGQTSFPSGSVVNHAVGSTVNLNGGTVVNGTSSIRFVPPINGAGMIRNDAANHIGFYADNNLAVGAYLDVTNGKFHATGGVSVPVDGETVDLGAFIAELRAEISSLKAKLAARPDV